MMSSDVLVCPANNPNFKDLKFTIVYHKVKQQILILVEMEPVPFIKIVAD